MKHAPPPGSGSEPSAPDPERPAACRSLDWDSSETRAFADAAIDIWIELLDTLRERPVVPDRSLEQVRREVWADIPEQPMPRDQLLDVLRRLALENSAYSGHPGFMAYIIGAGTVPGAVGELLAAAINQNVGGWRHAPGATELELALMRWFASRFGMPSSAGGLTVSGGAMGNFTALKVARDAKAGWDTRERGVRAGPPLAMYAAETVHAVNARALDMLGLGRDALRTIAVDDRERLDVDALRSEIAADRDRGWRPIAVIATAGTVSVGAIDPLEAIANVCEENDLWFHVDGSYGAVAALAPSLRPLFRGIERADSIAFDPHKWLYVPYGCGAVVCRRMGDLHRSFRLTADYLHDNEELSAHELDLHKYSPQLSRGFGALKVWTSLAAHGTAAYCKRIEHDIALARYLRARVEARPDFEPVGPQSLSIVCFRYKPPRAGPLDDDYLDSLNKQLMLGLQRSGGVFPSHAVIRGRFALRACIVNFRVEADDLDRLLDTAAELGARLDRKMSTEG